MARKEEISIMIPEQYSSSSSGSLSSPPVDSLANQLKTEPPTHRLLLPLDRVGGVTNEPIGPKKRTRRGGQPRTPQQQARSVARRNARERKRVRLVNLGFSSLRDHIPPHLGVSTTPEQSLKNRGATSPANKKLSKVETLRAAIEYIRQLREAIGYDDKDSTGASSDNFSSSSPLPDTSSSPSYCTTPSPVVMMLDSGSSTPMFEDDENDDFFSIMDWTTL